MIGELEDWVICYEVGLDWFGREEVPDIWFDFMQTLQRGFCSIAVEAPSRHHDN